MSGSVGRARLRRLVENWNCTAVRTFSEMLNFIKLNCTVKSGPFYRNWDGVVGSRLPWNWIIVARRERSTNWYQPQVTILRSYVFRHFSDDELPPAASRPHSSQTEITLIMFVCNLCKLVNTALVRQTKIQVCQKWINILQAIYFDLSVLDQQSGAENLPFITAQYY